MLGAMIHHASIPAENPRRVAQVLAELWGSRSLPFPGLDGAFWTGPGDTNGTMIDVYPSTTQLVPGHGEDGVDFRDGAKTVFSAWHLLVSVTIPTSRILEIAAREGWRSARVERQGGAFELVELWIENRVLIELVTPEGRAAYVRYMDPANPDGLFARTSAGSAE